MTSCKILGGLEQVGALRIGLRDLDLESGLLVNGFLIHAAHAADFLAQFADLRLERLPVAIRRGRGLRGGFDEADAMLVEDALGQSLDPHAEFLLFQARLLKLLLEAFAVRAERLEPLGLFRPTRLRRGLRFLERGDLRVQPLFALREFRQARLRVGDLALGLRLLRPEVLDPLLRREDLPVEVRDQVPRRRDALFQPAAPRFLLREFHLQPLDFVAHPVHGSLLVGQRAAGGFHLLLKLVALADGGGEFLLDRLLAFGVAADQLVNLGEFRAR